MKHLLRLSNQHDITEDFGPFQRRVEKITPHVSTSPEFFLAVGFDKHGHETSPHGRLWSLPETS
jgi:hypothetical protein